jgi:hypothetical protein
MTMMVSISHGYVPLCDLMIQRHLLVPLSQHRIPNISSTTSTRQRKHDLIAASTYLSPPAWKHPDCTRGFVALSMDSDLFPFPTRLTHKVQQAILHQALDYTAGNIATRRGRANVKKLASRNDTYPVARRNGLR